jgi:putative tricarboxylic transport membrane protein
MSPAAQRLTEAVCLLLLLLLGGLALTFGLHLGLGDEDMPGPGLFPAVVALLLLGLLGPLCLRLAAGSPSEAEAADTDGWRRVGLYLVGMAVAALALAPLGFVLGIGLALLLVLRFAEGLGWRGAAIATAIGIGACFVLFDRLLEVPLPRGTLWAG